MTLLEKMQELERLMGQGGWTEEMHLVEEGVEILNLLRSIYMEIESLDLKQRSFH